MYFIGEANETWCFIFGGGRGRGNTRNDERRDLE
jgi:hypothetical protein